MEKRTKIVKVRLTEAEFEQMKERSTKARLAEWIRETCLSAPARKPVKQVDPALLYELNRLGVNMNQLARYANRLDVVSKSTVLMHLTGIESDLQEVLKRHDS
jgi:hypothetical protein